MEVAVVHLLPWTRHAIETSLNVIAVISCRPPGRTSHSRRRPRLCCRVKFGRSRRRRHGQQRDAGQAQASHEQQSQHHPRGQRPVRRVAGSGSIAGPGGASRRESSATAANRSRAGCGKAWLSCSLRRPPHITAPIPSPSPIRTRPSAPYRGLCIGYCSHPTTLVYRATFPPRRRLLNRRDAASSTHRSTTAPLAPHPPTTLKLA